MNYQIINYGINFDHPHKTFHENLIRDALQSNPNLYNWVGIYYFEHYLFPNIQGQDLVLGGFIGAPSPHIRISLQKGICGRALREERTVVVDDVNKHPDYLACSLETKSEIVIPIFDASGKRAVAELDIDSHTLGAFVKEQSKFLEDLVKNYQKYF